MNGSLFPECSMADSIFVNGIKKALSAPELIHRIAEGVSLKRKLLETLRTEITEREIDDRYSPQTCNLIKKQPIAFSDASRKWIAEIFEEEDSDESDEEMSEQEYKQALRNHAKMRVCAANLSEDSQYLRFMHYSSDFLNYEDKWSVHKKAFDRLKRRKHKFLTPKEVSHPTCDSNSVCFDGSLRCETEEKPPLIPALISPQMKKKKTINMDMIRRKHWKMIAKKEIPKAFRNRIQVRSSRLAMLRRVSREVMKRQRGIAALSVKTSKEKTGRARRITREMQLFWKKYQKVEKVHRKKAEKHALERIRLDEEMREAKRQQLKLNFLISQTELFAHFMSKKLAKEKGSEYDERTQAIMKSIEKDYNEDSNPSSFSGIIDDSVDGSYYSKKAIENVYQAMDRQRSQTAAFNSEQSASTGRNNLTEKEVSQPSLFKGFLKSYQLKGLNWLVDLYEQGINGILADEMGLGKTVQTIAFFGHLAQRLNIWGPFLVVAPASTLNNWHQEFTKFFPDFKVLPYWGNPADRKILRKFWNQKASYHSDRTSAPFHVLITSYQLVISDVRYFQRIQWQYMVLDEAQALKSTASARWKTLLEFNCRNRLLLTGTPIQNTMAELWALLHFIMPSLFDSHNEFNEWFSKDIENHIENKAFIDETQLSRLHIILKPFMLRRIKRDVENELSEKIEIRVHCDMAPRQKSLYNAIKKNIKLEDLLRSTGNSYVSTGSGHTLMNLVMQFRKVCNHPDLLERREVISPFYCHAFPQYKIPKLLYEDGILARINPGRRKLLYFDLSIHQPCNVKPFCRNNFSFLRLLSIGAGQYWKLFCNGYPYQLLLIWKIMELKSQSYFKNIFHEAPSQCTPPLEKLLLTWPYLLKGFNVQSPFVELNFASMFSVMKYHPIAISAQPHFEVICLPKMISHIFLPPVTSPAHVIYCCDRNFCNEMLHPSEMSTLLDRSDPSNGFKSYKERSIHPVGVSSNIRIPSKDYLITDSGKLNALDVLLAKLKKEQHRVLIYSQMTRMIDILEEFMLHRNYTYIRLDGSSRISERRDMVADFQNRSDIFAFLLSTRAGGLGINLTAADTVIFYDSDWNPTVDQQAMDRAHRLGQTKQVTVYRLVCQGTVDERILKRAEEKNAIQRMVIAGGNFKPDLLKTKEVVSLLLDDEQLIQRLRMRREENKGEMLPYKGKKRGRKTNAEREAKRLKQLQEQGISGTVIDASSGNFTITHSDTNPPAQPDLFDTKFLVASNMPDDSESSLLLDSAPASPSSGTSVSCESSNPDAETIVVDDVSPESLVSSSKVLNVRARGVGRGRGRPRIRPLTHDVQRRRQTPVRNTPPRRRASRARRIFTGRAAAMAGARAGAAAASAATYAAYGYGLEPADATTASQKDSKSVSKTSSIT